MRKHLILFSAIFCCLFHSAVAQINQQALMEVKDSIVARYNRNDFKGVYRLADTAFSNHISEQQLAAFLRGNRNSGNILQSTLQAGADGKPSFLLECETRNIQMNLVVTVAKKFSDFGFINVPVVLLAKPKAVKRNNPLKNAFDQKVDSLVLDYFCNPSAAGISLGIINNGVIHTYHYGQSNKITEQLPTSQTLYEIGSVTKTFTATLLAQAVTEGRVNLNDDIRKFLSGNYPNLIYGNKPVTLQDLANHTSRLPLLPHDIGQQPGFNPLTPELHYDSAMFFAALHQVKLDTIPGYKYNYSNWRISLLGYILEKVYQQPYSVLLKKYITGPFGMKNTYYQLTKDQKKAMALPYTDNGRQGPFQQEGMFAPAGDIHATLPDMLLYLKQQIQETNPAVKRTHQPTIKNVGLGWGIRNNGTFRDFQHNGSSLGFTAHISGYPEFKSGLVILANSKADTGPIIRTIQQMLKAR